LLLWRDGSPGDLRNAAADSPLFRLCPHRHGLVAQSVVLAAAMVWAYSVRGRLWVTAPLLRDGVDWAPVEEKLGEHNAIVMRANGALVVP